MSIRSRGVARAILVVLLLVCSTSAFQQPQQVTPLARRPDDKSLNRTDPQIPRSVWWLADGGFIGFRVLCEP